jgi:hypothetical protein
MHSHPYLHALTSFPCCCCFQGAEHEAFIKVAQSNEDATFVQTTDKAVAKEADLDKAGSVTVITNFPSKCTKVQKGLWLLLPQLKAFLSA